ncbi:SusC/RagA family TonB-linked outer membrane protein [Desertivirga xinjiangensis]|uniref:SusC/RagA family TonB-linked outer membrane protein n=1 Tax=Desertivirga xinjiangensis TaxID=539206 RepID=UPI00210A63C2|nr:TonB-dependent receptor [Pedobacter xinjiangensis]
MFRRSTPPFRGSRIPCKHYLLLFIFLSLSLAGFAQRKISGTVKDSQGEGLAAISVKIKGKATGSQTDLSGNFSLVVQDNDVVIFSGIGFEDYHLNVSDKTFYSIVLNKKINDLQEVIVIGYGTAKKGDLTGAVSSVSVESMNKAPVRSFDEALAGRIAGVNVSSVDGQPGSAVNITVRGPNSITQDNSPLYVIDGFPLEDPNNNVLNPQEIESMEVLKDASATAIYGSRGANGVIIITTKRGKEGPPVISLSTSYGLQKDMKRMDLMSPYEFVQYQIDRSPSDARAIYLPEGRSIDYYQTVENIDWQDQLFRTAPMSNTSLSIKGGSKTTKYSVSGNAIAQDGVIINSSYRRYQGSFALDHTLSKKLKGGVYLNLANNKQNGISPSNPASQSSTAYTLFSVYGYRNFSVGNSDLVDELFDPSVDPTQDLRMNPVINQQHLFRENLSRNTILNTYLDYSINPKLKLRITGGLNTTLGQNSAFNDTSTVYGNRRTQFGSKNGVNGSVFNNVSTTWTNENTLTYYHTYKKRHNFTVLGGFTQSGYKFESDGASATNLPNPQLGLSGLDEGIAQPVRALSSSWGLVSFLGRVDYKYRNRYLVTLSYRADGSSKFRPGNRWGYFPSGAFAWRFSEENFMKNINVISDAKLRVSYGKTGNNRIGEFAYLPSIIVGINPQGYTFGNGTISGAIPGNAGNKDLKWETTAQTDIGLDLGLFRNKISITADVYRKRTRDLLLNANVPLSQGYSFANRNIGSVQNQGIEFSLNSTNINSRKFSWKSSFNISFNQSKILSLAENQEAIPAYAPFDTYFRTIPAFISKTGNQIGMMYGYIYDGVYRYSDFDMTTTGNYILKDNISTNGNNRSLIQPGDIKFKDINGDFTVDANDYAVIGRGLPIHTGGLNNELKFKNFDLNVFFQWSYGNDILNANRYMFEGNILGRSNLNQYATYLDRWTPENPNASLPRAGFMGWGPTTPTGTNSRVIEDGSYLRLKTLQLGYSFPAKLTQKLKIKSLRAYVASQNVFTWTGYSGVDPEVSVFNSVLTPGVDFSAYPRPRTITLGANILF